jgi:hypothetical protein
MGRKSKKPFDRGSFSDRILSNRSWWNGTQTTEVNELDDVNLKHKSRKVATNKSKQVMKKKNVNQNNTKFPSEYFGSSIGSRLKVKQFKYGR